MSETFEVTGSTRGLVVGQRITREELDRDHKRLGGAERLLALGSLKRSFGPSSTPESGVDPRSAELNTGSPEPIGQDENAKQAQKLASAPVGDASARANPATGKPGTVKKSG